MFLLQCYQAYFTVSVTLVWYRLLARIKLLDLLRSVVLYTLMCAGERRPSFNTRDLLAEVESRTQGSRPRPRTQKKSEAKDSLSRTDTLEAKAKDQEHKRKCSPKKKGLHKNFSSDLQKKRPSQKFFKRSPQKNVFQKNFQALHKILTIQKIVLSLSRGQANFRGLEASRPRPRT